MLQKEELIQKVMGKFLKEDSLMVKRGYIAETLTICEENDVFVACHTDDEFIETLYLNCIAEGLDAIVSGKHGFSV